jgi:hypothetical protein
MPGFIARSNPRYVFLATATNTLYILSKANEPTRFYYFCLVLLLLSGLLPTIYWAVFCAGFT